MRKRIYASINIIKNTQRYKIIIFVIVFIFTVFANHGLVASKSSHLVSAVIAANLPVAAPAFLSNKRFKISFPVASLIALADIFLQISVNVKSKIEKKKKTHYYEIYNITNKTFTQLHCYIQEIQQIIYLCFFSKSKKEDKRVDQHHIFVDAFQVK